MDIALGMLKDFIFYTLLILITAFTSAFTMQTLKFITEYRKLNKGKRKKSKKWHKKHFKRYLLKSKYMLIVDFIKWVIVDTFRLRDRFKLFGIWTFTGYYGEGKTLGGLLFAKKIKKDYPDYHIYTNFVCNFADGRIEKWEDLLSVPRKTIIIFDEIQSTFTSTNWSAFPVELLWHLTQCRKKKLAVFASSPVYDRMTIQLRESTDNVVVCKNHFGLDRLFSYTFYKKDKYERYIENPIKLRMNRMYTMWFTASDWDYRMYNTEQIVDRMQITDEKETVKKGIDKYQIDKMIENKLIQFERNIKKLIGQ